VKWSDGAVQQVPVALQDYDGWCDRNSTRSLQHERGCDNRRQKKAPLRGAPSFRTWRFFTSCCSLLSSSTGAQCSRNDPGYVVAFGQLHRRHPSAGGAPHGRFLISPAVPSPLLCP